MKRSPAEVDLYLLTFRRSVSNTFGGKIMVRCIAVLLAGTSCAVALTTGVANSRAESGLQTSLGEVTFDGLTIGSTTLNEFIIHCRNRQRARNPKWRRSCRRNGGDGKYGVESFTITGAPNCDAIECDFVNGRLYKISVLYLAQRVDKIGGVDAIVETITSRFGLSSPAVREERSADGDKRTIVYTWESPERSRHFRVGERISLTTHCNIALRVISSAAKLEIVDASAESTLSERRVKNANLGF